MPLPALAAHTAAVTLFCYSIKFHPATGPGGYTLTFTAMDGTPNGELAPYFVSHTHLGFFSLDDGFLPLEGVMRVNAPLNTDANGNGFADFFETAQGVATMTTSGQYVTDFTQGTVSATWSRAAGSAQGTCVLSLTDIVFGWLGNYTHTFELLEYRGSLTYTPGQTNVTGTVALTRTGQPAASLGGAIEFWKSVTAPFNLLTLQPGFWTNATGDSWVFSDKTDVSRDPRWPTNYFGVVWMDDGELATPLPDYEAWGLSIDDANDSDGDGIPDFSDTPGSGGPARPTLSLHRLGNLLVLAISGEVGRTHRLLETTNFPTGPSITNLSLTLTNDPHILSLPWAPGGPHFWRALAE